MTRPKAVYVPLSIVEAAVSPEARIAWIYMSYRQGSNGSCWPSVERIGADLHLSVWATRKALRELTMAGFVAREQPKIGRGHPARYQVRDKGSENQSLLEDKGSGFQHRKGLDLQQNVRVYKEEDYSNQENKENRGVLVEMFEKVRKLYPGTKRGFSTEFKDFTRKHKDWRKVLPLLMPAIEGQIRARQAKQARKEFVPEWPHFRTWVNQRRWEEQGGPEFQQAPQPVAVEVGPDGVTARERLLREMEVLTHAT